MYEGRNIGLRMMVWLLVCGTVLLASVSFIKKNEKVCLQAMQSETSFSGLVNLLFEITEQGSDDSPMEDDSTDDSEESEYAFDTCSINKPTAYWFVMALPYAEALYHWSAQSEPDYQPRPPQV